MGLMKKLTSAIVASSLVFSLVGTAFAAYTPAAGETAGNRMMGLQILKGKYPTDALALKDEITRAELVTVIVRAFGQESNAALLKGAAAYPDTANHWASGNIAMAKALVEKAGGDAIGMPDGKFNPDGKLTPAQAVAFLMKFLGVKADATKTWPNNFLDVAVQQNIITAEDKAIVAPMLNDNATRGLVFYLFDRAFYSYDLGAGKTFYTKYVDVTAPVVTLGEVAATTIDSKVTITGKVEGATEVYVGTKSITVDANGNFSADYELPELKEYAIAVTARDVAGNVTEKAVAVTRTVGNVATLEAAAITVAAGAEVEVKAVAKDAKGNVIANAAITGESAVGTFAAGKFTAGKTAGTGTLTLKAGEATATVNVTVTAGALAKVEASAANVKVGEQVTLTAKDANGNTITGATFTQESADALLDGVKGVFMGSKAGTFTITATKDGQTATATVGVYSTTVAKLVVTAPATVVGNTDTSYVNAADDVYGNVYEVTVKAVDANGNLVANYGANAADDITLILPAGSAFVADADDTDADLSVAGKITKQAKNGSATFKVFAESAAIGRSFQFTASTVQGLNTIDGTKVTKANVEVVEQVATSVKINTTGTAKYLRSNDSTDETSVAVYVADQNGKRFLDTTGYVVNLSVTGAATLEIGGTSGKTSGTVTYSGAPQVIKFESIQGRTGDATLTASVEGLGTVTHTVTAAVAQDAAKIALTADKTTAVANDKEIVKYSVQITDANGVPVAKAVAVKGVFAFEDTNTNLTLTTGVGTFSNVMVVDTTNDVTTFQVTTDATGKATFELEAAKFVGDLKLTVKDNDSSFTVSEADTTVTFKADAAATFGLTRVDAINVNSATPSTQLSVQLYDGAGNKVATAGKKITFTATDDVKFNGTAKTLEVATNAEGKATVDVSVLGYVGNSYTVTVTAETGLTKVTGEDTIAITVVNAVASSLSYSLKDANGATVTRVKAGEAITLTIEAKDAAGKYVANDAIYFVPAGTVYTTLNAGVYGGAISKTSGIKIVDNADGTADGKYTLTIYPATAGTLSFTLKDTTSSTALEQAGSMRVTAGVANKLVINDGNAIKVKEGQASGAITLKLTDSFGNAVATTGAEEITIVDTNGVGIRTAVNAPNVSKLTIPAGASSIQFYVWNSLAKGTYAVTFDGTYDGSINVVVE